jgi:hypothetical protein
MSFKFNGTGFWLYGSTWYNHVRHEVSLNLAGAFLHVMTKGQLYRDGKQPAAG